MVARSPRLIDSWSLASYWADLRRRGKAPETHFIVTPGSPPALARFGGPRNYAGQQIRIE